MTIRDLILIIASVVMSGIAQIALKAGMSNDRVQHALAEGATRVHAAMTIATEPFVIAGLLLYGFGTLIWLLVLARIDVSAAYPFVGLSFIVTMALGGLLLHEAIEPARIAGTFLIVAGVVLVARTA